MKLNEILKREGLQLILLVVPFLVLIPLWDKFPPRVAIHWGINGHPNGWADKSWGLLLGPVINVFVVSLLGIKLGRDSLVRKYSPETQESLRRVFQVIRWITTGFLTAMALLIDAVALGWKLDVPMVVNFGMLLLFAMLGNYLPKLRPNRYVGIRTPWTLKSPEVWARTHRLFGPIMLLGALVLIPFILLAPMPWSTFMVIGFVLGVSVGAMIYSYVCYQALPPTS